MKPFNYDQMTYEERKQYRTEQYNKMHGRKYITCTCCNGSGYYDDGSGHHCSCCEGTGKVLEDGQE